MKRRRCRSDGLTTDALGRWAMGLRSLGHGLSWSAVDPVTVVSGFLTAVALAKVVSRTVIRAPQ
jgi:hypothetical protein